jgi:hypothetical protein
LVDRKDVFVFYSLGIWAVWATFVATLTPNQELLTSWGIWVMEITTPTITVLQIIGIVLVKFWPRKTHWGPVEPALRSSGLPRPPLSVWWWIRNMFVSVAGFVDAAFPLYLLYLNWSGFVVVGTVCHAGVGCASSALLLLDLPYLFSFLFLLISPFVILWVTIRYILRMTERIRGK